MPFSIHSTLREILADERARAVLEKHVPGSTSHPRLDEGKQLSLAEIASYPEAGLSRETLNAIGEDLRRL
jgi:hypothetical protein